AEVCCFIINIFQQNSSLQPNIGLVLLRSLLHKDSPSPASTYRLHFPSRNKQPFLLSGRCHYAALHGCSANQLPSVFTNRIRLTCIHPNPNIACQKTKTKSKTPKKWVKKSCPFFEWVVGAIYMPYDEFR
ncbi:MAG TPA: hypothetical protein VFO70_01740, partial [Chitinophagaceae bacterium]|nr:hypothetical protein [Chitinophagaceae bacterium]